MRPIGAPAKELPDGPAVLTWVLARLRHRRKLGVSISGEDRDFVQRITGLLTLFRAASAHAKAIRAATAVGVAESGLVNLRAMLELWGDFCLVARDQSNVHWREMYVAGSLAMLKKRPDPALEARVARATPAEYATVSRRFARRPFGHWSGGGRKKIVAENCGTVYGDLYELLSWDSHPIVQVVLDVQKLENSIGRFEVRHREDQHAVAGDQCVQAAHIVRAMWNALCAEVNEHRARTA